MSTNGPIRITNVTVHPIPPDEFAVEGYVEKGYVEKGYEDVHRDY